MTSTQAPVGPAELLGLRSIGGLRTHDGRKVRDGALLRSATPQFVGDEEASDFVRQSGITTIIDLRLAHEVDAEGSGGFTTSGVRRVNIPFRVGNRVSESSAVSPMTDADPLVGTYLGYLRDPSSFRQLIAELLRDETYPALIHCTVGKDRTGVAVGLVLDAIGVLRSEIVRDYSARAQDIGPMMDKLADMASYGDAVSVYPPEAYAAVPATVLRFLGWVDQLHGGSRAYLESVGVSGADLDALADRLLESDSRPVRTQILRSAVVGADPDRAWALLGDIGGVHRWVPGLSGADVAGDVRTATFADGSQARERVVAYDDAARAYTYAYLDGPIPLASYESTITVGPKLDGDGSLVVWNATLEADADTVTAVEGLYDGGLAAAAEQLG